MEKATKSQIIDLKLFLRQNQIPYNYFPFKDDENIEILSVFIPVNFTLETKK